MLHRILFAGLSLVAFTAIAADPPADLRDAEAWYRAARAEAERIGDPEQRHLIGQLVAASQKVAEEDAVKQVDEQRAKYGKLPGVEAWRISHAAARHYETLGFYRRAADELDQATREIPGLAAEKAEPLRELDDARSSLVARAAEHHLPLAEEIADKILDSQLREEAIKTLAYHWVEFDLKTVERLLTKIDEERRPQAFMLTLLHRNRSGKTPHLKRGIELLLQTAPTMSEADFGRILNCLQDLAKEIVATCDGEQLSRLIALLEQTPRDSKMRNFQAVNCLISLRVAQGRIDDALKLADADASRQKIRRFTISMSLIKEGRLAEAERASSELSWQLAAAYIKAGKPREALAAARRIDDLRIAYPHVIAALGMLPADDRDIAEQALQDLVYDDIRAHALAAWAVKLFEQKQPERARELAVRAEKQLMGITDAVQQRSAGLAVGRAYGQIGAQREADALLKKYGRPVHFLEVRLKSADQRLQAKDHAGFEREMTEALLILRGKQPLSFGENLANEEFSPELWQRPRPRQPDPRTDVPRAFFGPAPPVVPGPWPAAPQPQPLTHDEHEDAAIRFQYFLQASRLYRRAGDAKQARELAAAGIAAYSKVGGSFERWETLGMTFLDAKTPERLQELAELSQDAKNPADRAVLLTLGGALAKYLRDEAK